MAKRTQWLFRDPPSTAVVTAWRVLNREDPITLVSHDADGWQFLNTGDGRDPDMADAAVVELDVIVKLDPSVMQLAGMPVGWKVCRQSEKHDWVPIAPAKSRPAKKIAAQKKTAKKPTKKKSSKKPAAKKRTGRR